jgi:hypothetical protein
MICDECRLWSARSEQQWRARQRNLKQHPEVQINKCPACGGTEWATTRAHIIWSESTWWRRLIRRMSNS